jgi:hypothetical protein
MTEGVEQKPPQSDLCGIVSNVRIIEYWIADVVARSGRDLIKAVFCHLPSAPGANTDIFSESDRSPGRDLEYMLDTKYSATQSTGKCGQYR